MPTRAEEMLWLHLRAGRLDGLKFRRQVPIGPYIADFTCFEARLIVELDGPPHDDPVQRDHDESRDRWLRSQEFNVLRFSNDLVLGGGGDLVIEAVRQAATISRAAAPSSDPC
jgi:very-short-patch-repair endonuclease